MKVRLIFITFFGLIVLKSWGQSDLGESFRGQYKRAVENESVTDSLVKALDNREDDFPLLNAYKGGLAALESKHASNPFEKMRYLSQSQDLFEKAVKDAPDNIEIRFLRFSVQYNLPEKIRNDETYLDDKNVIVKNLDRYKEFGISSEFVKEIGDFLISTNLCDDREKKIIESVVNQ